MATKKAKKSPSKKAAPAKKAAPTSAKTPEQAPLIGAATVLDEMSKAVKCPQKKSEKDADFTARVIEEVSKLDDDSFGKLSKAAQDYFNECAEAINNDKPLPAPPIVGAKTSKVSEKAAPAAKEKKEKKEKGEGSGEKSTAFQVRKLVCEDHEIEFGAVAHKMGVEEDSTGHIWNIYNHAKKVLALALESGWKAPR